MAFYGCTTLEVMLLTPVGSRIVIAALSWRDGAADSPMPG
jgi:hypothetical protein